MLPIRRVAITGANGFLGRNSIKKAVQNGLIVRGVVRRQEAANLVEKLGAESVVIKQFDDTEFTNAFDGCYGVLHFIGIVSEQYGSLERTNVQGT